MTKTLEFHDIAAAFPRLDDVELEDMARSIEKSGLQEPITLFEGKILDGRNRYAAWDLAESNGGEKKGAIPTVTFKGSREAAEVFSIVKNILRRHLSDVQRGRAGLRLWSLYEQDAQKPGPNPSGDTSRKREVSPEPRARAAAAVGVAPNRLTEMRAVEVEAKKGNRKAIEALEKAERGELKTFKAVSDYSKPKSKKPGTTRSQLEQAVKTRDYIAAWIGKGKLSVDVKLVVDQIIELLEEAKLRG
jgi:hypothetical protein